MARQRVPLENSNEGVLLVGYDKPFQTYYAMLYTYAKDDDRLGDEPDKAVGYHPMERNPDEITEHGPYPCDVGVLIKTLVDWGLSDDEIAAAGEAIARDPDAPKG